MKATKGELHYPTNSLASLVLCLVFKAHALLPPLYIRLRAGKRLASSELVSFFCIFFIIKFGVCLHLSRPTDKGMLV